MKVPIQAQVWAAALEPAMYETQTIAGGRTRVVPLTTAQKKARSARRRRRADARIRDAIRKHGSMRLAMLAMAQELNDWEDYG